MTEKIVQQLEEFAQKKDGFDEACDYIINILQEENVNATILQTLETLFEKNQELLSFCAFECFTRLIPFVSKKETSDYATKILFKMARQASAKEVYSTIMESLSTKDLQVLKLLIKLLQIVLSRMKGSKWKFMSHSFPTLLSVTNSFVIMRDPTLMYDDELAMEMEKKRVESDAMFPQTLKESIDFVSEFAAEQKGVDGISKEKDWVLSFCFQLLAKIYSSDKLVTECEKYVPQIMKAISMCNYTLRYILLYDERYQTWFDLKQKLEQHEVEELSDDEELENDQKEVANFVQWNKDGVGLFAYLVLVKHIEEDEYERGVYSNVYIFKLCKPYIEKMVQGYASLTTPIIAKDFAKELLLSIPSSSIHLKKRETPIKTTEYVDLSFWLLFMQVMINFMAGCPDDKQRTDAWYMLMEYVSKFDDEGRFELLSSTLRTCPYDSFCGLLIHRLKEEIRLEYDGLLVKINRKLNPTKPYKPEKPTKQSVSSQTTPPPPPPVVNMDKETVEQLRLMSKQSMLLNDKIIKLLIDVLKKYEYPSLENSGVLLHGLNLYYYLLLRDVQPNITGIASKQLLKEFKDGIVDPLLKNTKTILQRFDEIQKEEEDEEITEEELKKYMEMESDEEDLDEKEISEEQQHTDRTKLTLWMVHDILQRIQIVMLQRMESSKQSTK